MNKRQDKGITLIILVITIVIMLILAGIGITSSMDLYNMSKKEVFITEMQMLQLNVDNLSSTEISTLGQAISSLDQEKQATITTIINTAYSNEEILDNTITNFRYFNSSSIKELGVENLEQEVIVNINKDIVSLKGINYNDIQYYTQYKLPNGNQKKTAETNSKVGDFDISVNFNGLMAQLVVSNARVIFSENNETAIFNPKLSYREKNENWQDMDGNSVFVNKSATYEIKLTNNVLSADKIKEVVLTLVNKPVLSDSYIPIITPKINNNGSYITTTDNGQWYNYNLESSFAYGEYSAEIYVWIPQYVYKLDENENVIIKFLKGNSTITTDDTTVDNTWTKERCFIQENDDCFLTQTGMWIKKATYENSNLKIREYYNQE